MHVRHFSFLFFIIYLIIFVHFNSQYFVYLPLFQFLCLFVTVLDHSLHVNKTKFTLWILFYVNTSIIFSNNSVGGNMKVHFSSLFWRLKTLLFKMNLLKEIKSTTTYLKIHFIFCKYFRKNLNHKWKLSFQFEKCSTLEITK